MYDELAAKVHSNAVKVPSNSELVFKCDSDKENLEKKKIKDNKKIPNIS